MDPRISVLINAYQRSHYLAGAVESVRINTFQGTGETEIVVVADSLPSALSDWLRDRGAKIVLSRHRSIGRRLAQGVAEAQGEVIAFLDDDDRFLPGKVPTLLRVFADPEVSFFRHSVIKVDENLVGHFPSRNGGARHPTGTGDKHVSFDLPLSREQLAVLRHTHALDNLSSMAVRRKSLIGRLDALSLVDVNPDFLIPCLLAGPGRMTVDRGDPLSLYRIHPSLSNGFFETDIQVQQYAEYIARGVRAFYAVGKASATEGARMFLECRARTWDVLHWALTGTWVAHEKSPMASIGQAILGNVKEQAYGSSVKVLVTAILGTFSPRLATNVVRRQKQREFRAALAANIRSSLPIPP